MWPVPYPRRTVGPLSWCPHTTQILRNNSTNLNGYSRVVDPSGLLAALFKNWNKGMGQVGNRTQVSGSTLGSVFCAALSQFLEMRHRFCVASAIQRETGLSELYPGSLWLVPPIPPCQFSSCISGCEIWFAKGASFAPFWRTRRLVSHSPECVNSMNVESREESEKFERGGCRRKGRGSSRVSWLEDDWRFS